MSTPETPKKMIKGLYIDPLIFSFPFGCRCSGECCHYGVYMDKAEYLNTLTLKDELLEIFDESQTKDISKWFEPEEEDKDFPSGIAVGTELHNGKCVFLDKEGLCSIQKLSMMKGEPKWKNKPLYCVLFPLTIYENTLTIDTDHIDRLKTCNKDGASMSIYDACSEEILHLFGTDGFEELKTYKKEFESANKTA